MSIFFFFLGAIVGSFLNVVVLRYGTGLSAMRGNSLCFSCGKRLEWFELVPIASFVFLRGSCRHCAARISWQYPIVELATALLFYAVWWVIRPSSPIEYALLLIHIVIMSFFVLITVYDIRHKIIPDLFSFCLALCALAATYVTLGNSLFLPPLLFTYIAAGPILALPFALLWLVSKGTWMGLGDAKLAIGIGWLLGLSKGFTAIMFAFWIGAVVGLLLIFLAKILTSRRMVIDREIPFAPFLILGTLLVYFFGFNIIGLYIW